ncbi:hypothetical protein AK812_SmicGene48943, partial [Symbiodinium microadriaticum]
GSLEGGPAARRRGKECCWRQNDHSFDIVCGTPACCAPEIWATQ